MDRRTTYESLRPSVKRIIDRIYGDMNGFVKIQTPHPLEKYILAFDRSMSDETVVRVLASRIGIFISFDIDANMAMIDALNEFIDTVEQWGPEDTRTQTTLSTKTIINMDREAFNKLSHRLGWKTNDEHYQNRLVILSRYIQHI